MTFTNPNNHDIIPDEILIKIFTYITTTNLHDICNTLIVSKR